MSKSPYPIPGAALVLFNRAGHVLLGERVGPHEGGAWGAPGGKVEKFQSPLEAVLEETWQETRLRPAGVEALPLVSSEAYPGEQEHYLCFWFIGHTDAEEVSYLETVGGQPKCRRWAYFAVEALGGLPLMRSTLAGVQLADRYRRGERPGMRITHEGGEP